MGAVQAGVVVGRHDGERWPELTLTQEGADARLPEVVVIGPGFVDAALGHDQERGAVHKAPFFVGIPGLVGQGGVKLSAGLGHNFGVFGLL